MDKIMSEPMPVSVEMSDNVLCQRIQDEALLLNMDTQQYYGLNPTASEMWNQLVELHDIQTAETQLRAAFQADPDVLRADLHGLVKDLIRAGLLKSSPPER
jgi:hypothetical protein